MRLLNARVSKAPARRLAQPRLEPLRPRCGQVLAFRGEVLSLESVPDVAGLVAGFSKRQLAFFCRVLALLVFESDDKPPAPAPAAAAGGGGDDVKIATARDLLAARREQALSPSVKNTDRNHAVRTPFSPRLPVSPLPSCPPRSLSFFRPHPFLTVSPAVDIRAREAIGAFSDRCFHSPRSDRSYTRLVYVGAHQAIDAAAAMAQVTYVPQLLMYGPNKVERWLKSRPKEHRQQRRPRIRDVHVAPARAMSVIGYRLMEQHALLARCPPWSRPTRLCGPFGPRGASRRVAAPGPDVS